MTGAEVVAVGIGKERDVRVELHPVDDVGVVGGAALRLPSLVNAQSNFVQVVGDLHAGRGNPTLHLVAEGVEPLVELRRGPLRQRRRNGRETERIDGKAAAEIFSLNVVQWIVERELSHALIRLGVQVFRLEFDLVGQPMHVPNVLSTSGSTAHIGSVARMPAW